MMVINNNKQRGSVAIELTFVLGALAMCMMFAGDLAAKMTIQGELDNLSYSMVNIIRDRSALYSTPHAKKVREELSKADAAQIDRIVRSTLSRQRVGFSEHKYALIVEGAQFYNAASKDIPPSIKNYDIFQFGNRQLSCDVLDKSEFTTLAPYTNKKRYMPMYRVTVCYESPDLFQRFAQSSSQPIVIRSSSINVGR
ncbi:hypothetical protein A3K86_12525 [Photobacterium jeanii]|uniref:Uncharacterized protein n=1 Tax=Photobacterium jeanii TaxID=858640 RepID=A0A178K9L8_9GAMM|nr:tight adherence pilus pseudopilin TadF [Photobacterium jeanii]OAN14031.1 hypothetical protein A3K86_12525 [Photobacterium jeanii]PST86956.1 hypothetical protein C9I91_20290 [Photobacterium jeanii]